MLHGNRMNINQKEPRNHEVHVHIKMGTLKNHTSRRSMWVKIMLISTKKNRSPMISIHKNLKEPEINEILVLRDTNISMDEKDP